MAHPARIFVSLQLTSGYARQVMQGIRAYQHDRVRQRRPWMLLMWSEDSPNALTDILRGWRPDGFLMQAHPKREEELLAAGLPAVNVSAAYEAPRLPTVIPDDALLGEEAAHYFLERGYRHLAGVFRSDLAYAAARGAGFRKVVEAAGLVCHSSEAFLGRRYGARYDRHVRDEGIMAWLHSLPRPVGIFAVYYAPEVLDACLAANINVPGEVAVLGSDLDEIECEMLYPPLSCAGIPGRRVGYEAARLLDRLLDGEPPPDAPILLAPTGVTTRASTRALAIEDPDVRAAVAYIEAHAAEPISAADIVAQTMLTRCTLEKRFARVRGNSVHEELLRTRLRIARHLLIETELRTDEVARRAGFRWAAYLCEAFTREMGLAPSRYRAQFGLAPCGGEGPTS